MTPVACTLEQWRKQRPSDCGPLSSAKNVHTQVHPAPGPQRLRPLSSRARHILHNRKGSNRIHSGFRIPIYRYGWFWIWMCIRTQLCVGIIVVLSMYRILLIVIPLRLDRPLLSRKLSPGLDWNFISRDVLFCHVTPLVTDPCLRPWPGGVVSATAGPEPCGRPARPSRPPLPVVSGAWR